MSIKEILLSFQNIIPDVSMILVSLFGSIILLILTPILHLMNLYRIKQFPKPRVIVITGATSGIGKSLALKYTDERVVLGLVGRNLERLNEIKEECDKKSKTGCKIELAQIDVTDREKLSHWLKEFDKKHSGVDLIIANAGVSDLTLPIMSYDEKTIEVMNINANGAIYSILPLLPMFRKRKHGQIAIVSSLSPMLSMMYPAYSGSKAGITSYGTALRQELAPYGIGVTVICPGFVYTPMSEPLGLKTLPFGVSPDVAADTIHQGISLNKAFIGFSLPTLLTTYFVSLIPLNLRDSLIPLFSKLVDTPTDTIVYTTDKELLKYSDEKDKQLKLQSLSQATIINKKKD